MFSSRQTCSSKGNTNITISSSDTVTDVAVLAISVFIDLHINELWIAFGKGRLSVDSGSSYDKGAWAKM
jgi:hypothetical protein